MTGTMQYLPPVRQQGQPQSGAEKYHGAIAQGYDAKRESSAKWTVEQRIIEDMLSDLPPGSWILDAPCGTGRFLDYAIRQQFVYMGLDRSEDMIRQAAAKVGGKSAVFTFTNPDGTTEDVPQIHFTKGDVLKPNIPDQSVDAALNIRITRWLTPDECRTMFKEMQRISRDRIVLTARTQHPRADLSRPYALFETVLSDDWELARSECGGSGPAENPVEDPQYRIFLFKRKQTGTPAQPKSDDAWIMDPYEAA